MAVTRIDDSGVIHDELPAMLPGGRHMLYFKHAEASGIYLADIGMAPDDQSSTPLIGTSEVVLVDIDGTETAVAAPPRLYQTPAIAPDGARIALKINDDIWIWAAGDLIFVQNWLEGLKRREARD